MKPGDAALNITLPKLRPVARGGVTGRVEPCGTKIVVGVTVIFARSLLASVTKAPPGGAGTAKLSGSTAD